MDDVITIKHSKKKPINRGRWVDSPKWIEMRKQKFLKYMKELKDY